MKKYIEDFCNWFRSYLLIPITMCIIVVLVTLAGIVIKSHINDTTNARYFGGGMTIDLDAGYKLEDVDWKDSNIWYTVRPMRDGEEAETHIYKEYRANDSKSGSVTVVEHKEVE